MFIASFRSHVPEFVEMVGVDVHILVDTTRLILGCFPNCKLRAQVMENLDPFPAVGSFIPLVVVVLDTLEKGLVLTLRHR